MSTVIEINFFKNQDFNSAEAFILPFLLRVVHMSQLSRGKPRVGVEAVVNR